MELRCVVRAWLGKFYSGVVIESITPLYYAEPGNFQPRFEIQGRGLLQIPANAVARWSLYNDNPTWAQTGTWEGGVFAILDRTDTSIVFRASTNHTYDLNDVPFYLGCITSPDGSIVYWINNSQPLP